MEDPRYDRTLVIWHRPGPPQDAVAVGNAAALVAHAAAIQAGGGESSGIQPVSTFQEGPQDKKPDKKVALPVMRAGKRRQVLAAAGDAGCALATQTRRTFRVGEK